MIARFFELVIIGILCFIILFFCILSGACAVVVIAATDITPGTRFNALILGIASALTAYFFIDFLRKNS